MLENNFIESEEKLIIETPERVSLEFSLASIGNRFIAVAVDHVIQFLFLLSVTWLFVTAIGGMAELEAKTAEVFQGSTKWLYAILILVLFLIYTGYFVFFEWLWNGRTPGKRLMKLRVIREDGRPVTLWEALARNILRFVDNLPGFLIPLYSIGLIVLFMNRRDQRLGDMFAGTVVIREQSGEAPTFSETFMTDATDEAMQRYQPQTDFKADISSLTESEVGVAESFLRRRLDLPSNQRTWLAWRVALPILYKLKPEYDKENFSYEGFLEELVHRYNAKRKSLD